MDKEFIGGTLIIIGLIGICMFLLKDYEHSQNYIRQNINKHPECATARSIYRCLKVLEEE